MNALDISIFRFINDFAGRSRFLDAAGIFFAKYVVLFLALFLVFKWFQQRGEADYRGMLLLSIGTFLLAEALAKALGMLYSHPQPFAVLPAVRQLIAKEVGNSFPSDHTVLVFSFMTLLFIHTKTKSRYLYLLVALLVGLARIFVGVHYPSDVLAGALLSVFVGIVFYFGFHRSSRLHQVLQRISRLEAAIIDKRKK